MCPSLLQIIFIWFLPESPRYDVPPFHTLTADINCTRWLISKGRGEEAYAVLTKYHAEGDVNSPFVKAEYVARL